MPGDVINAEVYAKYLDTNQTNWTTAVNNLITSIANGTAAAGTYVDGGAVGSTGGAVDPFASILNKGSETGGTAPKAYLNYLVFDRNYNVLDGGFVRVTEAAKESGTDVPHERLSKQLTIKEAGYVYIYLSNDNATLGGNPIEVYFDDFKFEHIKSPVIQAEDYYPFGLAFNSYSKENSMPDLYQYNGKEMQNELGLEWLDYGARMYMQEIGRWGCVDPHADNYEITSPYTYAFNNPMLFVDPNGMDNVIYLLVAGNFDKDKAKDVAAKATKILNDLGLKMEVKVYDSKENGAFDPSKLDKTDNWAVIGDDRKAVAKMARSIDRKGNQERDENGKSDYEYDIDTWEARGRGGNPEMANKKNGQKGIVVDYDDTLSPNDKGTSAALYLNHAAAHSSKEGIKHESDGIMADGNKLQSEHFNYKYKFLFKAQYNQAYIKRMKERYSSPKAMDNYKNKKK